MATLNPLTLQKVITEVSFQIKAFKLMTKNLLSDIKNSAKYC